MLEKGQWSLAPNGVFSSSDSTKEGSSLASENTTPSSRDIKNNHMNSSCYELCGNVAILGDKITDVDSNSFSDPLSGINHTGNNLNFFENAEDKDSSDFSYYDWPGIENFEDVNRMFRNCDSTFGLGASKENGLDWFSSADNVGGSGDVMNSDLKFSCPESNPVENISPDHDSLKSYSFNDSAMMSAPVGLKDSPWMSDKLDSYVSFVNGPAISHGKEGFIPKAQMNEHQKQAKPQNQSKGKRKDHGFGNGCVGYMNKLPNEVLQISSGTISHHVFPSLHMQQQQHALGSDHCNYLENHHSYMHADNSPLSDLTLVNPTSSAVKSEANYLTSTSPRDSSHPSNQLSFMDGCHDSPLTVTPTGTGKREKLHSHQGARSSVDSILKHTNAIVHTALDDPGSIAKETQYSGAKSENHSDIEDGHLFIPSELGSSNAQESSTTSSGTDDISLEAASFCQLQLVMEQLDLRTKACIRDSLYRLAQSAEQRHYNQTNLNGGCGDGTSSSGAFMSEGENKLLDMETDTNEIDRSVAHLLFHRSSESSPMPAHDSLPSTISI
ncbi:hypothetical protein ACS0TY_011700 [Phlomoides rotata]